MEYAIVNNQRITASPNLKGICPGCNEEVIAKCGDINVWHWSHKSGTDCDDFWEPETEWHRSWKKYVDEDCREVILKYGDHIHRADILVNNTVIELQNSPIQSHEIMMREGFYISVCKKKMIWIINGNDMTDRFIIKPKYDYETEQVKFYTFKWKWMKRSWYYGTTNKSEVYIELGWDLFHIKRLYDNGNGWGYLIRRIDFIKLYGIHPKECFNEQFN